MRLLSLVSLFVLISDPAHGEQRFQAAVPSRSSDGEVSQFVFTYGGMDCLVKPSGLGNCRRNGRVWRFQLPMAGGVIDSLYVTPEDALILAYSVADAESGWSKIAGFKKGTKRPEWVHNVRGLNLKEPVLLAEFVLVGAAHHVSAISRTDGALLWRHEWLYDGSGRTVPKLAVHKDQVQLKLTNPTGQRTKELHCFLLVTGAPTICASEWSEGD